MQFHTYIFCCCSSKFGIAVAWYWQIGHEKMQKTRFFNIAATKRNISHKNGLLVFICCVTSFKGKYCIFFSCMTTRKKNVAKENKMTMTWKRFVQILCSLYETLNRFEIFFMCGQTFCGVWYTDITRF